MPLILDCKKLILDFKKCKIHHIFRKDNGVVMLWQKEIVGLELNFHVLCNPPLVF